MTMQFPRRALVPALASVITGAATLSAPAHAVYLANDDGLGDAAVYQYYTAKSGWQTFFRVINTSTDAVVIKVRFREAANSREVLDFEVALSPNDMWTGWTDANAIGDGRPGIKTNDTSCVFPRPGQSFPNDEGFVSLDPSTNLIGAVFKDRAYTGVYDDSGPDAATRLSEGHIEVIGVSSYSSDGSDNDEARFVGAVSHNGATGKPNDCASAQFDYLNSNDAGRLTCPTCSGRMPTSSIWPLGKARAMIRISSVHARSIRCATWRWRAIPSGPRQLCRTTLYRRCRRRRKPGALEWSRPDSGANHRLQGGRHQ